MRAAKLIKRVVATGLLMFFISVFVFITMRFLPGDPVDLILGQGGQLTPDQIAALRANYQLDKPLHTQLLAFLAGLLHGNLGESVVYSQPVTKIILGHLPATVELTVVAVVFALLISVPVAVLSAVKRNSPVDRLSMAGSFLGISMPGFWLGIVLIMVFGVHLRWLPVFGRTAPGFESIGPSGFQVFDALWNRNFEALTAALKHLILPAVTMSTVLVAILTRVLRSSLVEELQKDYVRLARMKGASERRVILQHVLWNALIPAVTIFGLQVGSMLGGNIIVETVFGWPGIGRLATDAIFSRDYPLIQGIVIMFAFIFAIANLLVDIVYTWLNPQVTL